VGSAQVKDGSLNQADISPNVITKVFRVPGFQSVTAWSIKPGTITEDKLDPALKAKVNAVGTGGVGPAGPKGDTGPQGPAGTNAIVSVTANTVLNNRPDSGLNGDWAKDQLTRTVSITKQAAVEASKCGAAATTCWFYTGSLIDNGTFTTIADAKSPEKGTTISGTLTGSVSGGTKLEFYASSQTPNASLVQASVDGGAYPTSTWAKQFFAPGTVVTDAKLLDWSWTYTATTPNTCEKWVNALAGNSGDIKGVNAC
jgi:hypothetical protein